MNPNRQPHAPFPDLSAAVLAGGRSSRMGRNKALLPLNGKPIIEHVVHAARQVAQRTLLITNQPEEFAFLGLDMHPDVIPGIGPIGGIVTALEHCPTAYCLILACDLPFMSPEILHALARHREDHHRAVVLDVGRGPEPLCGIYARSCLPAVHEHIRNDDYQLQALLQRLGAAVVPWQIRGGIDPLLNINTPTDFEKAQKMLRRHESLPPGDR